jgi:hypothetical protein
MSRRFSIAGLLICASLSTAAAAPTSKTGSSDSSGVDEGHFSAAALFGFGFSLGGPDFPLRGSQNIYGFGFGARGGYVFPNHLYAGAKFLYYLGHTEDYTIQGGGTASISGKLWTLVAEAGYQFEWDAIRLRPFLGLGIANVTGGTIVGNQSSSSSTAYFAIQPGATFEYSFSGPAPGPFIGADVHFSISTGSNTSGLVFLATGGYRW